LIGKATDAPCLGASDDWSMKTSYGVVWCEGSESVAAGKLELLSKGLRLEGRDGVRNIPYATLSSVRIGRAASDRLSGQPSVVIEHSGGVPVTIATVAQPSLINEIAERLAALQLKSREESRSWMSRQETTNLSYLSTAGPGDSEGGDVF
jgi:hypothetical protein